MKNQDFVEKMDYFKNVMIAFGHVPAETKDVQEGEEQLSDASEVKDIPWYSLKYTIIAPGFDVAAFTVCFIRGYECSPNKYHFILGILVRGRKGEVRKTPRAPRKARKLERT